MIVVQPSLVIPGTYSFTPRNNQIQQVCVWDGEGRIFPLEYGTDFVRLNESVGAFSQGTSPGWGMVSFHPSEPRWIEAQQDHFTVIDSRKGTRLSQDMPVESVLYSRGGDYIWVAGHVDEDTVQVMTYTDDGEMVAEVKVADDLGASALSLEDIPDTDAVVMVLAAGQDGVETWELALSDGVIHSREMCPQGSYRSFAWRTDGARFLAVDNNTNTVACFSYPSLDVQSAQSDDLVNYGDESSLPGYDMVWLSNGQAIVQGMDYRFWLFDPDTLTRIEEVAIAGWEPVSTREVYPRLDDDSLMSVIGEWKRVGDLLIAKTLDGWKNPALFIFSEADLIEQLS